MTRQLPDKTIGRLSLYRRLLTDHWPVEIPFIFSHQVARLAQVSPAQVRRDLMGTRCSGSPGRGYEVSALIEALGALLDAADPVRVALVGVGNLGRAVLTFFRGRHPRIEIAAAFDIAPDKAGRPIVGVHCHPMERLAEVVAELGIHTAILSVPGPQAQPVLDCLVAAGVRGILNFAPVPLRVPSGVHVENLDMATALEKVVYHAGRKAGAVRWES